MVRWSRGEVRTVKLPQIHGVHMMLLGFAIENLLKGYLIREVDFETVEREGRLPKPFKDHRLLELVELAKFPAGRSDENLLARLSQAAIWSGRYPIPIEASGLSATTKLKDGRRTMVRMAALADLDGVARLIDRVKAHVGYDSAMSPPEAP